MAIASDDIGEADGALEKETEEYLKRAPKNLEKNLGTRLLYAYESLESINAGLKLQLKMLEYTEFINQELKRRKSKKARQDKIMEIFMMQGARLSSLTKKLAKVNMSRTLSGLGKTRIRKKMCDENNNSVMFKGAKWTTVAIIFGFIDHALK